MSKSEYKYKVCVVTLVVSMVLGMCGCAQADLPSDGHIYTLPESTIPVEARGTEIPMGVTAESEAVVTKTVAASETSVEEAPVETRAADTTGTEETSVEATSAVEATSVVEAPEEMGSEGTETSSDVEPEEDSEAVAEEAVSEEEVVEEVIEETSEDEEPWDEEPESSESVAKEMSESEQAAEEPSESETETEETSESEQEDSGYPVPSYYPLDIPACKSIADTAIRQAIVDACGDHEINGFDENGDPKMYYFRFDDSLMANQQKRADTANEAGIITHAPMEGTYLPDSESCCSMLAVFDYMGSKPLNEWYFQGWPKDSQDHQEIYDDFYTFVYNSAYMLVTVHGENLSREAEYLYFGFGFSMIAVPDPVVGMEMPLYAMEIYVGADKYRDPWWD